MKDNRIKKVLRKMEEEKIPQIIVTSAESIFYLTGKMIRPGERFIALYLDSNGNHKFIVKTMPLVTTLGLLLYALIPTFFPNVAYLGLLIGTVIFSISAGLSEVLLSPTIAALPSDNPQRDMSTLHSLYAFGVFFVATVSTVFLKIFGTLLGIIY